jgi:hypothetical protein
LITDPDLRLELRNLGDADLSPSEGHLITFARAFQRRLGIATVIANMDADCRCNSGLGACDCDSGEKCKTEECTEIILDCGCGGTPVNCNRKCAIPAEW